MEFRIASDEFGRLVCTASDGTSSAVITSSDFAQGCADLAAAMDALETNGIAECYWREAGGEYRWVFRRSNDNVRVAVLWATGVMTGWEHVLWTECGCADLLKTMRGELARAATAAA